MNGPFTEIALLLLIAALFGAPVLLPNSTRGYRPPPGDDQPIEGLHRPSRCKIKVERR